MSDPYCFDVPVILWSDRHFAFTRVVSHPADILFVDDRIRTDKKFLHDVININPDIINYIGYNDRDLVLSAVCRKASLYHNLPSKFKNDHEITMAAIKKNWFHQ